MQPQIVLIIENTLTSMALRSLLQDMVPGVDVVCFNSVEAYNSAPPARVVHYFVSASIIFQNSETFKPIAQRTIVLTDGKASPFIQSGFRTIDTTLSEQHLVRQILQFHHVGHPGGHGRKMSPTYEAIVESSEKQTHSQELSSREKDVLALVVKGCINKEIADKLNISLATVVFHRNNISEKLQTRSIGRLTIYAVLNNIVSLSEI